MRVIFSKLAKQELDDATRYYEVELQGFGKLFREEVRKAAKRIAVYPGHGLSNEVMSGKVFYTSFRTNCFIPLKKITSLSLPLHISIENQIIGLIAINYLLYHKNYLMLLN